MPGQPLPVLFAFHGGGGNASSAANLYGLVEEAERRGYLAIFPEGSGVLGGPPTFMLETWNGGSCCGYAMENGVDDVQFFADALAKVGTLWTVDADRVFLTGMSNGAMMSYRIAAERPELVRAIAPVAGSFEAPGPPRGPVSVFAFHGLLDGNVPFQGGVGTGPSQTDFNSQLDSLLPFLAAASATLLPAPVVIGQAQIFVAPGSGDAHVLYALLLDGGHTWPGSAGSPLNPAEPVHQDVSATELMFDFFELHP